MGKSFLATQLAERINVPNVLQTNLVYEFLNSVKYRFARLSSRTDAFNAKVAHPTTVVG
jgi:2-phosphoglycerate kinase